MTTQDKQERVRLGVLERILGRNKANDVTSELDTLAGELDKLGLRRKSFDSLFKQKGVLEDLHTDIATALTKFQENVPEEVVNEVIALAMGRLLQGDAVVEEEVMAEGDEEEVVAETEEDVVEEEFRSRRTKELLAQVKENNQRIDDLATETHQVVKDMGEMAGLLVPVLKLFAGAKPMLDGAKDFDKRLSALESQIKARPRQASQDASTQATEAEATKLKSQNLEDVPELFRGAFTGGQ